MTKKKLKEISNDQVRKGLVSDISAPAKKSKVVGKKAEIEMDRKLRKRKKK